MLHFWHNQGSTAPVPALCVRRPAGPAGSCMALARLLPQLVQEATRGLSTALAVAASRPGCPRCPDCSPVLNCGPCSSATPAEIAPVRAASLTLALAILISFCLGLAAHSLFFGRRVVTPDGKNQIKGGRGVWVGDK